MDWIYNSSDPLLKTVGAAIIIFVAIILFTRIVGLRSFAKFTVFDFAFTVAIGSIISSILTSSTSVVHGSVAIASLLVMTSIVAYFQRKYKSFDKLISNEPLLLMRGNDILIENLKHAHIDKNQLIAKLREANVLNYNQVCAVVLETTGDISVLHKSEDDDETVFDNILLSGVKSKP